MNEARSGSARTGIDETRALVFTIADDPQEASGIDHGYPKERRFG